MATYYFSPTGSNVTGDGSSGNPWQTLAYTYTNSAANDILIAMAGTHTWADQDFATNRTVRGIAPTSAGLTTIFDGGGASVRWDFSVDTVAVTIENIQFQDAADSSSYAIFNGYVAAVGHIYYLTIRSCAFKEISVHTSNGACGIFGNPSASINIDTPHVLCEETLFDDPVCDPAAYSGGIIGNRLASGWTFEFNNCTFYFAESGGTNIKCVMSDFTAVYGIFALKNCIMMNATGLTINYFGDGGSYQGTSGTNTITYSCINAMTGAPSATNSITSDPLFVDAANGNFNLRPTSPCIDTGTMV